MREDITQILPDPLLASLNEEISNLSNLSCICQLCVEDVWSVRAM